MAKTSKDNIQKEDELCVTFHERSVSSNDTFAAAQTIVVFRETGTSEEEAKLLEPVHPLTEERRQMR